MRTLSKTAVALGLVVLMSGPVLARQGQRRGGGWGGLPMLLSNASVQQELKLDPVQIEKAKQVVEKMRKKWAAGRESLESLEGEERAKRFHELSTEVHDATNTAVKEFLTKEQLHRLHQIHYQLIGAKAFEDAHVQKKLDLTDEQKSSIDSILHAFNHEARSIHHRSKADHEAAWAKISELNKETLAKIEAKLTPEQKAAYEKLLGTPFELKREAPSH
jgi:hypothetical protein